MTWALAATFGASAATSPAEAIAGDLPAPPATLQRDSLRIAAAREPLPDAPGRSLCALAGAVYDVERPARAAELDPGLPLLELLARAHARLGARVLDGLRGDFCLLFLDPGRGEVLVARDHMGGMPVYWHRGSGTTVIATDPRAALRMLPTRPEPDLGAMVHWVTPSGIQGDRTLYSGLCRLQAGHFLLLTADGARSERYWSPRYAKPRATSREEVVAGLGERLAVSVARRTPERGGAVLLSGGLDSSTVAAFAAQQDPKVITSGYSAVFPDHPGVDETEQIDLLGDSLGLRGIRAEVRSGSVVAGALDYIERFELPPVSPNLFFWNRLFDRAAADGVTALLDGEGGDELFGISPMLLADRLRRGRVRSARALIDEIPGAGGKAPPHAVRHFMREFGVRGALPGVAQRLSRRLNGPDRYTEPYLLPAGKRAFMTDLDEISWKKLPGPRWWAYLVDITTRGVGPSLVYEHVALRARQAGIEARHPLVDADVIEYVLSIPPEMAFDHRRSRPLVRDTTAGVLPDAVRLRPSKSSFDQVFHAAMAGSDLPLLRGLLGSADTRITAFVDIDAVRRELLDPDPPTAPRLRQAWALKLWRMATAELWMRLQEDPASPRKLVEAAGLPAPDVKLTAREPADTGFPA